MRPRLVLFAAWAATAAFPAAATDVHGGLEGCRGLAERELRREMPAASVVLERGGQLHLDTRRRNAGRQPVAAVLSGQGALTLPGSVATEVEFVCLLGADRQALFFYWLPRRDAPALAQCRRSTGLDIGECLDVLQRLADDELARGYGERLEQARQRDAATGGETHAERFRRSAAAWRAYRDAECARRGDDEIARRACYVELTRRRALDLR